MEFHTGFTFSCPSFPCFASLWNTTELPWFSCPCQFSDSIWLDFFSVITPDSSYTPVSYSFLPRPWFSVFSPCACPGSLVGPCSPLVIHLFTNLYITHHLSTHLLFIDHLLCSRCCAWWWELRNNEKFIIKQNHILRGITRTILTSPTPTPHEQPEIWSKYMKH